MGKLQKEQCSTNGVIVTVYEESSARVGSRCQKTRPINSNPAPRPCGYDRRAELRAYAHQLRSASAQQVHQDNSNTTTSTSTDIPNKPKKRKRLWAKLKALKLNFGRVFGRKESWRYEPIESKGSSSSLCHDNGKWSKINKKMRNVLKMFSCGCKCAKGFQQNEEHQDFHQTIYK